MAANRMDYYSRPGNDECPLTYEHAESILKRLELLEERTDAIPLMQSQLGEIHDKIIHTKGLLTGVKMGAMVILISLSLLYGFMSGNLSAKEFLKMFL